MTEGRQIRQVLVETGARSKLQLLPMELADLLSGGVYGVPEAPGRDVQILPIRELPPKKGLSSREGQARMLHDLASIELQAMELGLRTLIEFPMAPEEFRKELAEVTADEGRHFGLCLDALSSLEIPWGSFPTHIGLWQSVSGEDSLLDRILIVHRYLEGSGLDASDTLLRRLDGVNAPAVKECVRVIRNDEMGHVQFGSRWYRKIAEMEGLDADSDFAPRLQSLFHRIPRRLEPISHATRREAGFSDSEISTLEIIRQQWLNPPSERIHKLT